MDMLKNGTSVFAYNWRRLRFPIISIFIFYHTAALVLWNCPPFPLYPNMVSLIRPYVCYFGFWNQWKMFSHPKIFNIHLTANVSMQDGTIINWNFPRMENLDVITRTQKEPYRKWAHEYVNEETYKFAWPEACKFVARKVQTKTSKPVKIELVRHWTWIQPPKGFGEALPEGELHYAYYTYDVKPEDIL